MTKMMSVADAAALIATGAKLFLAGSENCLLKLPQGNWIAGTIPYFMTETGGVITHDQIHVTELPPQAINISIQSYDDKNLKNIPANYFANGFSLIVISAFTDVHSRYANECMLWPDVFNQPLVGWISGIELTSKTESPKIMNGKTGEMISDQALVMHVELSNDVAAMANIVNIFEQSNGDTISFTKAGFEVDTALINGTEMSLAKYLEDKKVDLKIPLVADYMGALVNVSFRDLNPTTKTVRFFAPVFPDVNYKLAKPVNHYEKQFETALKDRKIEDPIFACNCILNFMYANLEGKKTGNISSAMTFGEIAYMLLNQTFVYITLVPKT